MTMDAERGRSGLLPLVAANAVSNLGNVVAVVALPWFVLVTTGSAARAGLTAFATTLPLALGAILGGPIVDRVGARRASVVADLGSGTAIACIPLLHALGSLEFWQLVALAFTAGVFEAPGRAARRAMLPDLAARARMALERANSISTTSEHIGYVLGAPLAGVLIAWAGAPNALWLDAGSFAVSAVGVALAVTDLRPAVGRTRLLDGVRYVVGQPLLRTFFVIWTVGAFFIAPLAAVVLPVYAHRELGGAGALAATVTAYGVGGLAGTLVFGIAATRLPRRPFFVAMWIVYPALTLVLVTVPPLPLLLVILLAIGFVTGAYDPFEVTIQQERIPPELRARAFSILIAAEMIVVPPSMLLYGVVIEEAGLRAGLLLFGLGNLVLGAFAILSRSTRRLEAEATA
jgi:MFS family permease